VARRERLEGAEGMAADVGRDVDLADLLLGQLQRREHRPLRATDAEAGRPSRQRPLELRRHLLAPARLSSSQAVTGWVSRSDR
jgi:hypothetical protein